MKTRFAYTYVRVSGLILTALFFASGPTFGAEMPAEFLGHYTDNKTGCPTNNGYLVVSPEGYKTYMTRVNKGKTYVDEHACSVISVSESKAGTREIHFSCFAAFPDLGTVRPGLPTETWRKSANGEIIIDNFHIYRPCE